MDNQPQPLTLQWREALFFSILALAASLIVRLNGVNWVDDPEKTQTYAGMLTTIVLCGGLWVSFKAKTQKVPLPIFAAFAVPGPLALTLSLPTHTQVVYHILGLAGMALILSIQHKASQPPSA